MGVESELSGAKLDAVKRKRSRLKLTLNSVAVMKCYSANQQFIYACWPSQTARTSCRSLATFNCQTFHSLSSVIRADQPHKVLKFGSDPAMAKQVEARSRLREGTYRDAGIVGHHNS